MEKKKVIVTERIAEEGIALLKTELEVDYRDGISREELLNIIDQYDALIVRSVTQVDEELISRGKTQGGRPGRQWHRQYRWISSSLRGYSNNTPDSNTISAAEQTISLLLSSVRNTAWASSYLKE